MKVEFFLTDKNHAAFVRANRFYLFETEDQEDLALNFCIQCDYFGWPITFPEPRINAGNSTEYPVIRFFISPQGGEIRYEIVEWTEAQNFDPFAQPSKPAGGETPDSMAVKPEKMKPTSKP